MISIDPELPLNCPRCGERLTYVTTEKDQTLVYICSVHGEHRLSSDGYLRGGSGPYGRSTQAATEH